MRSRFDKDFPKVWTKLKTTLTYFSLCAAVLVFVAVPFRLSEAFTVSNIDFRLTRQAQFTSQLQTMKTDSPIAARPSVEALADVRKQMQQDGKSSAVVPTSVFAATVAVMVPIWFTTMLPLSLLYQSAKIVFQRIVPPKQFVPMSPFDSGHKVTASDMIPRAKRTYDIVVMGATGFVGKLTARYMATTYGVNKDVKWAIAGRSKDKLEETKRWLAKELGMTEVMEIDCIVADTSVPSSLPNLVRDTRVLLTTVGPFWQYGSSVVEFCAKFGTHYADTTGETSWVRKMMDQWQSTAQKTGAKMISLAGHDSIPWDLSVSTVAKQLKDETGEDLASVTCFNEAKAGASGGTLATIMLQVCGPPKLGPKDDPFRMKADGTENSSPFESKIKFFPSKLINPVDQKPAFGSPFLMSFINADVVAWSHALRGGTPLSYSEVLVSPDFKTAFVSYFMLMLLFTGLLNPITKNILSKYILPKPGEGPTMEEMEKKNFLLVSTLGTGTKGSKVESTMYFPRDAGYLDTARMLVETGLCMALEEERLPVQTGGFFSPGYGLGEILLNRLTKTGTYFKSGVTKNES